MDSIYDSIVSLIGTVPEGFEPLAWVIVACFTYLIMCNLLGWINVFLGGRQ